jgi:hypothetical protein
MTKLLIGGFLIAHGLVHAAVWASPKGTAQPFDPSRSWLLETFGIAPGPARTLSIMLAVAAATGFVAAGLALFAGSDWWRVIAIVTAAESLPLFLLFFNPWLTLGAAIELGILYSLVVSHWPAEAVVGA